MIPGFIIHEFIISKNSCRAYIFSFKISANNLGEAFKTPPEKLTLSFSFLRKMKIISNEF